MLNLRKSLQKRSMPGELLKIFFTCGLQQRSGAQLQLF